MCSEPPLILYTQIARRHGVKVEIQASQIKLDPSKDKGSHPAPVLSVTGEIIGVPPFTLSVRLGLAHCSLLSKQSVKLIDKPPLLLQQPVERPLMAETCAGSLHERKCVGFFGKVGQGKVDGSRT